MTGNGVLGLNRDSSMPIYRMESLKIPITKGDDQHTMFIADLSLGRLLFEHVGHYTKG